MKKVIIISYPTQLRLTSGCFEVFGFNYFLIYMKQGNCRLIKQFLGLFAQPSKFCYFFLQKSYHSPYLYNVFGVEVGVLTTLHPPPPLKLLLRITHPKDTLQRVCPCHRFLVFLTPHPSKMNILNTAFWSNYLRTHPRVRSCC